MPATLLPIITHAFRCWQTWVDGTLPTLPHALDVVPGAGIDPHGLPGGHKEGHLHDGARLQCGGFGPAAYSVASKTRHGLDDLQVHRIGQLDAERRLLVEDHRHIHVLPEKPG